MRIALLLLLSGCVGLSSRQQLVEAATSRLGCSLDKLEVAIISETTHWVRGCGQFAIYELDCAAMGTCVWRIQGKPIPRP